jgi:MoxR-like ATPase
MEIGDAEGEFSAALSAISDAVVAKRSLLETVFAGILARGHVLLEDVPGTGKTLTARTIARVLGLSFSRVQFTPDLLPADVTGTHVFDERERTFEFREGPLFANVILADEINRAPPKTQSALLEAMEERQVTVDGETRALPDPFFVIATQNPIESEGVFPLLEAQLDRFLVKTRLGYPDRAAEISLLNRRLAREAQSPTAEPVLTHEDVRRLQRLPKSVRVEGDLRGYIVGIARGTREDHRVGTGVSPRGTQRLLEASRARAVLSGREYVVPDDVKQVARPVLAHRLVLTPDATIEEIGEREVISTILDEVPVPTLD